MNDPELALLSTWRFTKVRAYDKIPYPNNWQTHHLPLYAIPQNENVGVVLGEASEGLMALDFDGPTSWTWFMENIGCDLPTTVIWKSGKEDRCQMAFTIPEEYWPYIRTKKITTKPGNKAIGLKPEQMEFRWNGLQSVLPPSTHPEHKDGYSYEWLNSPTNTKVAQLPDAILSWLLSQGMPIINPVKQQTDIYSVHTAEFELLEKNLQKLKEHYPSLEYDNWIAVMFAVANEIGDGAAAIVMNTYWPEQQQGEYLAHLRGRQPGRITPGTILYMIRKYEPNYMKSISKIIKNNLQFKEKKI